MATPSAYSLYGTTRTTGPTQQAFQSFMGNANTGPTQYSQPLDNLRPFRDVTTINTLGNLTPEQRINTLAQRKYQDIAANQQAYNMTLQNNWNQGLQGLGNLSRGDRDQIFEGYRSMGLLPEQPSQPGMPLYNYRQANPTSLQNERLIGMANRSTLAAYGINPNSVQKAYSQFQAGRY